MSELERGEIRPADGFVGGEDPACRQLSLERPDPAKRAPADKDEHIRQLQAINLQQAERIKWLTTVKRKLTKDELAAVVHVLESPTHRFGSCPDGTRQLCKYREAAMSARDKLKQAIT